MTVAADVEKAIEVPPGARMESVNVDSLTKRGTGFRGYYRATVQASGMDTELSVVAELTDLNVGDEIVVVWWKKPAESPDASG